MHCVTMGAQAPTVWSQFWVEEQVPSVSQARPVWPVTVVQMSCSFWCAPLQAVCPLAVQGHPSVGVPATQPAIGTQLPVLQTIPAAQVAPSVAFPLALQTDVPLVHEVVPILQAMPVGVQEVPWVHEQLPPAQARFVPQVVPLVAGVFWSTQTGAPLEHDCAPT
jgi:hypothetical protein